MKKRTLIQFSIACIVLFAVVGVNWWWASRIVVARENVNTLATKIAAKRDAVMRTSVIHSELASFTRSNSVLSAYFVSDSNIVPFLGALGATGRATGASISILSVALHDKTAHKTLSVSVKANGSFNAVMRTVGAIENVPYYVTIKSLSLSSVTTTNSKSYTPWEANMVLSVGYASTTIATTTSKSTP